jgi:hypothetical protein
MIALANSEFNSDNAVIASLCIEVARRNILLTAVFTESSGSVINT